MQTLTASDFRAAAAPQPLVADEIHLWWLPDWGGPNRAAAESTAVRDLLGAYLGRALATTQIVRGARGKPRLVDGALEFNLAHSGGDLLLGLSRDTPLGVDLELPGRHRPVEQLAARYFDPREAQALAAMPDDAARQAAFLRLWTLKEAVLKVDGGGIASGLERAAFALDAAGRPSAPLAIALPLVADDWCVRRLEWPDGAVGALAWRGAQRTVLAWRKTEA